MSKSTHFIGQPLYNQVISLLNREKILSISRKNNGERYVKSFNGWEHLVVMLYSIIKRFDSLREIEASMQAEARKLSHLGVKRLPRRSTLADANARRSEKFFGEVYQWLYLTYKERISSDSRCGKTPKWMKRLQIMDSTTVSLFSNLIFKGVGRNPKTGKKKGGIKVHTVIQANEGVPSDVCFTSAATNDHFLLAPERLKADDILAIDRAYIDYEKFEQITQKSAWYVTKMKKNLIYTVQSDTMWQTPDGKMQYRIREVTFTKKKKEETITHKAKIVTYIDIKPHKAKEVDLLTNNFELSPDEIVDIYRARWTIESLFKQLKQNFPLHFFYGESANAIKIQIWVTLIANLLLTILQRGLVKSWSFSNLATIIRIVLMEYIDFYSFFNNPEKDWQRLQSVMAESPPEPSLFG